MVLRPLEGRAAAGYAVFGSLWEQGEVPADAGFVLKSGGKEIPVQSRPTAFWPDGSLKWAAHTADAVLMGEEAELTAVSGGHPEDGITVLEDEGVLRITAGSAEITIPRSGDVLFCDFRTEGTLRAETGTLCALLERRPDGDIDGVPVRTEVEKLTGRVKSARVVECGALRCVVLAEGIHVCPETGTERFPFRVYMEICRDSPEIRFQHTFLYDGKEETDFLKGIGMEVTFPAAGPLYNRHVRFGIDHGSFSEAGILLQSWRPRIEPEIYARQIRGEKLDLDPEADRDILAAAADMPAWNSYELWQDSDAHFSIRKKTAVKNGSAVLALNGERAEGSVAVSSECGGVMVALANIWKKYPASLRVTGLTADRAKVQVWFRSPSSEAMDFRHYTDRGYSQTYYEGFDTFGASAYGIANTGECVLRAFGGDLPAKEELTDLQARAQARSVYVAEPSFYAEKQAFGCWGMPAAGSEAGRQLESLLNRCLDFYLEEQKARRWYGMYDYGDVMHTYDDTRHVWRYDMGGYAWQNTELVPTLWLWLSFLRSGRADVFAFAEAMTKHCADVDVYHAGPLKGLGSRHNVSHWGCPCKEARIAMAHHHRFYYYLTGDWRIGDVLDEVKDADYSIVGMDPLRFFFTEEQKKLFPTHARSGPDWSSFCSNWMTQWERHRDSRYEEKIRIGIEDLKKAPLRLVSGTDFGYDPETSHLYYIGERATGGTHLQICQGAEQVWLEMTQVMGDPVWDEMLAEYGRFYAKSHEEQYAESGGAIGERVFSYPFMAAGIIAYAAWYYKDHELGRKVWDILYEALDGEIGKTRMDEAFAPVTVPDAGNQAQLSEIPHVSTNVVSQWCLNAITALAFVAGDLPERFR